MLVCPECRHPRVSIVQQCSGCGLVIEAIDGIPVMLSRRDREDPLFNQYYGSYQALSMHDLEQGIMHERYSNHQADKFLSYLAGDRYESVCEVGVGRGILLSRLKALNPKNLVAIDISIPYLVEARKSPGVTAIAANAENIPFADEFDVLIATDILEHVVNISDFLVSANWALRERGVLAVRVPNGDNMRQYARLLGAKYQYSHVRSFDQSSLKRLIEQFGFKVRRCHYDGFYSYRRRPFTERPPFKKLVDRYIEQRYATAHDVASIANSFGRILMKPLELIALAEKTETVSSM